MVRYRKQQLYKRHLCFVNEFSDSESSILWSDTLIDFPNKLFSYPDQRSNLMLPKLRKFPSFSLEILSKIFSSFTIFVGTFG